MPNVSPNAYDVDRVTALAPTMDASINRMEKTAPTAGPTCDDSDLARLYAFVNALIFPEPVPLRLKANAMAIMIALAPMTTIIAPKTVSARSYGIHRGVMRLSTTLDCWKKSCHGVMVVPTIATMRSTPSDLKPPCTPGTTKCWSTGPRVG